MGRWSVSSGIERRMAFVRSCCAPAALALLLIVPPQIAWSQSPALQPPSQAIPPKTEGATQSPALDTPAANPVAHDAQTVPGAPTPTLPPPPTPAAPLPAPEAPKPHPQPARPSEDLATALQRTGSLTLKGLSLEAALFTISEQWNINIVAGEVKGTVNGVFKDAPLHEILDAILLSNGYNYRQVGKSLVITSIEQLGQINPFFQSAVIPVQSADIDEVVQGAQLLKTPKGEVRPLKSAHSIVVLDFPDRVKMIRDFVATLDGAGSGRFASAEARNGIPLEVGYFRTQHISAKAAEQMLQTVLSKSGKASAMDKEDRLLVTDYADNLEMVEKVLKSIDRPRPQVRITALIYDISLQDIEKMGINWNHQIHGHPDASGDPQAVIGIDSITSVPFTAGSPGSAVTFMNLSKHFDITAVVQALQGAKDARLLANPNAVVLENEEAIFEKVQEIPYQQLTQTQQGGSIGTTSFKKAGITLHVSPKISVEGLIRMNVNPEVSRLVGFTPGDNQPIIDTSSAQTVLTVANKQTVAIGGLRTRNDAAEFNGIPYLKDLNVVGRLFRSRDIDVREGELVVFISPEIESYADEPNCREKIALETVRCRLDQIPEAEGCPPCCRRLPCEPCDAGAPTMDGGPAGGNATSASGGPTEAAEHELPPNNQSTPTDGASLKQPGSLEPLSARRIPSAEFQFGAAGKNEQVRALMAEGRLRRLPIVDSTSAQVAAAAPVTPGMFSAPPAMPVPEIDNGPQTANRELNEPVYR